MPHRDVSAVTSSNLQSDSLLAHVMSRPQRPPRHPSKWTERLRPGGGSHMQQCTCLRLGPKTPLCHADTPCSDRLAAKQVARVAVALQPRRIAA